MPLPSRGDALVLRLELTRFWQRRKLPYEPMHSQETAGKGTLMSHRRAGQFSLRDRDRAVGGEKGGAGVNEGRLEKLMLRTAAVDVRHSLRGGFLLMMMSC